MTGLLAFVAVILLLTQQVHAEQQMPSRQDREIIMAAVNIGLIEEQRPRFRETVATLIESYHSSVLRISRGHNATNLDRKIDRKLDSLVHEMDVAMSAFLSREQLARYQVYRELLLVKLTQRPDPDSGDLLQWETQVIPHH